MAKSSLAQDTNPVWIQIESAPSLSKAKERLRHYSANFPDVAGFQAKTGWYAIALGPYAQQDAVELHHRYLAERRIPGDAFTTDNAHYTRQIWPIGASRQTNVPRVETEPLPRPASPVAAETELPSDRVNPIASSLPDIPKALPKETLAKALQTEARLNGAERATIQTALEWAGFYQGPIDAAFGPGTRAAMQAWQEANNLLPLTGVLTTAQRQKLLDDYEAVLKELGIELVRDEQVGIETRLPTKLVEFDTYTWPFSRYRPRTDFPAEVLFISRKSGRYTLTALYGLMQTLDFVSGSEKQELSKDGFILSGQKGSTISHTQVWRIRGKIKGYTLIWPVGDEKRRHHVLKELQDSFHSFGPALEEPAKEMIQQQYDLASDLEPDKLLLNRSGFYVDPKGWVLTSADIDRQCGRITVNNMAFELAGADQDAGLALLKPKTATAAPSAIARLAPGLATGGKLAVAGYSWGGVLNTPSLTFGTLAAVQQNTPDLSYLSMSLQESDVGGAVLNTRGAVLGMVVPAASVNTTWSVNAVKLRQFLESAGVSLNSENSGPELAPDALARYARDFVVLVECWQ